MESLWVFLPNVFTERVHTHTYTNIYVLMYLFVNYVIVIVMYCRVKYLTTLYLHLWILMWLFKIINNYAELDQKPYKIRTVEWNIKVPYIFIREFTIMMWVCKIINNDTEADQKPCKVREDKRKVSCPKIFSFSNTHFEKLEKYWIDCKSNKSFFYF